jgi:hypothetical protein
MSFSKHAMGELLLWIPLARHGAPPFGKYVLGCDVSAGQGGAYGSNSTISIVNVKTGVKVGEFASPTMNPYNLAELAVALCHWFEDGEGNSAHLIWEVNNYGNLFRERVLNIGFQNFYWQTPLDTTKRKPSRKPGWNSTPTNKRLMLGRYRSSLREGFFINYSEMALKECLAYVEGTNDSVSFSRAAKMSEDPANAGKNHGDRVIADGLANFYMEELGGGITAASVADKKRLEWENPPSNSVGGRLQAYRRERLKKEGNDYWINS